MFDGQDDKYERWLQIIKKGGPCPHQKISCHQDNPEKGKSQSRKLL